MSDMSAHPEDILKDFLVEYANISENQVLRTPTYELLKEHRQKTGEPVYKDELMANAHDIMGEVEEESALLKKLDKEIERFYLKALKCKELGKLPPLKKFKMLGTFKTLRKNVRDIEDMRHPHGVFNNPGLLKDEVDQWRLYSTQCFLKRIRQGSAHDQSGNLKDAEYYRRMGPVFICLETGKRVGFDEAFAHACETFFLSNDCVEIDVMSWTVKMALLRVEAKFGQAALNERVRCMLCKSTRIYLKKEKGKEQILIKHAKKHKQQELEDTEVIYTPLRVKTADGNWQQIEVDEIEEMPAAIERIYAKDLKLGSDYIGDHFCLRCDQIKKVRIHWTDVKETYDFTSCVALKFSSLADHMRSHHDWEMGPEDVVRAPKGYQSKPRHHFS